ncbi:unnamed protein product [Oikopleura dioica]|uniref:Uncharacterized protein n=1 Tax=Oikopleura dioica TaxID=34765 RepID=E4Y1P0_OIKDI|nr:unnamed protein product [Oikopleura dioica]CBY43180.1 unnamed protein product [Oikopleura dioica]
MKILSFLIGSLMAQGPAPEPAPEPTKKTNILFINMNRATIQMNMGNFTNSSVPSVDASGGSFDIMTNLDTSEQATLDAMLSNSDVESGLKILADKVPGFSSFYNALYPSETTSN